MTSSFVCPFCGTNHTSKNEMESVWFRCLGEFPLHLAQCERELEERQYSEQEKVLAWAKLAHYIAHKYLYYKRPINTGIPPIDFKWVLDNTELPTPAQQADNLLEYLSRGTHHLGESLTITYESLQGRQIRAWIGAVNRANFLTILRELEKRGLISNVRPPSAESWICQLTIAGWTRAQELQQKNIQSKQAFMAMKFDKEQIKFIKEKLVPVVKETGYALNLLTDIPSKENLIDNKLRVAIRQSRFLVCDLTHCNAGAYWEAGYAEGLKLPVIYICEKSAFEDEDKTKRPHFDVNHQEIFQWDKSDEKSIAGFLSDLKAKIQVMLG